MPAAERARISRRFMRQAGRDEEAGKQAEDTAQERLTSFDAEDAARRSAGAQFDEFREDLGKTLGDVRGSQVGRGRISSGFGFQEEDELIEGGLKDLGRTLTQNALQAQGLNLQASGQLGQIGGQRSGRFLDVLASERDADIDEEELKRRDQERKRSGLFGTLGRIGGTLLGPAGSIVGEKLGDKIGSLFG